MGSLSSSAKAPSPQPQVVYTPAVPSTTEASIENDDGNTAAKSREDNLLRRARGRLGTVATGLHGFLSEGNKNDKRKTLLGE